MGNRKENAKANAQIETSEEDIETNTEIENIEEDTGTETEKADDMPTEDVENGEPKTDKSHYDEKVKGNKQNNSNVNEAEPKTGTGERLPQQFNVLVSLKHPQGIVFTMPDNRRVLINGNATHLRGLKKGILPSGGFGLTTVSRDDWDYIKKTYGGMNVFKNGLIFAGSDYASATDMQKDHDEIKSGMEPVSVGNESPVEELRKVDKASVKDS